MLQMQGARVLVRDRLEFPRLVAGVTIPCFSCGDLFERKRLSGHYCPECRKTRRRKRSAEIKAESRRTAREVTKQVEQISSDDEPNGYSTLIIRVESQAEGEYRQQMGMVKDLMPPGSASAYGAEDGRSTYDTELADALDSLSARAEFHRWWLDNPHWNIKLYG